LFRNVFPHFSNRRSASYHGGPWRESRCVSSIKGPNTGEIAFIEKFNPLRAAARLAADVLASTPNSPFATLSEVRLFRVQQHGGLHVEGAGAGAHGISCGVVAAPRCCD
jgi:hypothetical protein